MFVVCYSLVVGGSCLLFVVCCLLHVVCGFRVCCSLRGVRCSSLVACGV